ncbi:class III extradiol dioxygenase subunit B-like domain-containing protein [Streptomyces sp. NPDC003691]
MLVAAAVCPCPPLLVPEVAAGAAAELDAVRSACLDAVAALAAAGPELLVVVGTAAGQEPGRYPSGSTGGFRGFGVDTEVRLGPGEPGGRPLPYPLAVGAWLLEQAGWASSPVAGLAVGERLAPEECAATGRETAARAARVALLVMGDGSACRTLKAPGYLDERAALFDRAAARALGDADVTALAALDANLAYELKAAGRAPWQVLAGAAEGARPTGRLLAEEAPYGVGYLVASWT